jgi:hypothetical protein
MYLRICRYKWAILTTPKYASMQNVIMVLKIRAPLIRSVSYLQIHLGGRHEGEPR